MGCDSIPQRDLSSGALFQSTHPRGVRLGGQLHHLTQDGVSIHAPAWGATTTWAFLRVSLISFQSTHPRGVRPWPVLHAPPQGHVSIHAPAWGATRIFVMTDSPDLLFQSTHPRGVRHPLTVPSPSRYIVSIHAPAWGATSIRRCCLRRAGGFNPRTRVGCDWWGMEDGPSVKVFQSTHPRGVRRPRRAASRRLPKLFQSTHPRGVRHRAAVPCRGTRTRVSIHAPAWGATLYVRPLLSSVLRFQSTHPRGVRPHGPYASYSG